MEVEESGKTRVTIRVPERLLEEYDSLLDEQDTNRSEDLRSYMRSKVKAGDDDGLQPPDDELLATAYRALRRASGGREMPLREARSITARDTNIPKESVSRRVLKPLCDRGYLRRTGDPINDPWVAIR